MKLSEVSRTLDELLDLEEGLSPWEVEFVEDVNRGRRECQEEEVRWMPTIAQRDKIMQIGDNRL